MGKKGKVDRDGAAAKGEQKHQKSVRHGHSVLHPDSHRDRVWLIKTQTHQHRSICTPPGDTPNPNIWEPQIKELKPGLQLCLWGLRSELVISFQQRQGLSKAGSGSNIALKTQN